MQQTEKLSAYMDGYEVEGEFTETLCNDTELQQKWANYHCIRQVMRAEEALLPIDFSEKMAKLIEDEEIESTQSQVAQTSKGVLKLHRWRTAFQQMAIAASVCLIAVVGVNMVNTQEEVAQVEQPVLQTLPFSNAIQPVSYNSPSKVQPSEAQIEHQQRRINALLQNHELQRRTLGEQLGGNEREKQGSQTSATEIPTP